MEQTPQDEFLNALNKIEEFTNQSKKELSRFEKAIDFLQMLFFTDYREKKELKKTQVKKELIKSVGMIKIYLPLLDKYKKGSPEEKKFASNILTILEKFNEAIAHPQDMQKDLSIEMTPHFAHQKISTAPETDIKIDRFFRSHEKQPLNPPSQEEIDTLKMKAIRLIEGHENFKEIIIDNISESASLKFEEVSQNGETVTLTQTWSHLPGEVHRIVGDFKRETRHSIPIKDSFKLFLESTQSGHPHPSQHLGWALSHWLIPSSVLWIDQIPLLKPLIQRKHKAAQELLPNGGFNKRARRLFRLKKRVFNHNNLEYLAFHQELAQSILQASPTLDEDESQQKIITNFYHLMTKEMNAFETLSKVHEDMNRFYVEIPFEGMEEFRLNRNFPALFHVNKELRAKAVLNLFTEEREKAIQEFNLQSQYNTEFEKAKFDYISLLGRVIGDSCQNLLILQLSEKFMIKPLPLTDFDLKLQACAFKHLIEFLDELEEDIDWDIPQNKETIKPRMRLQIHKEIELISSPSFENSDPFLQELVEEVVSYFHARFHATEN